MALESGLGDEGIDSLAALHNAEEEKEREAQSGYGKTQEKIDHHWSKAVDQGTIRLSVPLLPCIYNNIIMLIC